MYDEDNVYVLTKELVTSFSFMENAIMETGANGLIELLMVHLWNVGELVGGQKSIVIMISLLIILQILLEEVEEAEVEEEVEESVAKEMRIVVVKETEMAVVHLLDEHHPATEEEGVVRDDVAHPEAMDDLVDKGMEEEMEVGVVEDEVVDLREEAEVVVMV